MCALTVLDWQSGWKWANRQISKWYLQLCTYILFISKITHFVSHWYRQLQFQQHNGQTMEFVGNIKTEKQLPWHKIEKCYVNNAGSRYQLWYSNISKHTTHCVSIGNFYENIQHGYLLFSHSFFPSKIIVQSIDIDSTRSSSVASSLTENPNSQAFLPSSVFLCVLIVPAYFSFSCLTLVSCGQRKKSKFHV